MPIPFTCPHCGTQTSVDDRYAGQTGPCGSCGQTITVPQVGGVPPSYSPPQRSSAGPTVAIVIAAVLGVVVVCGGGLVALLLPAVQAAREAARRSQCTNNLKQIGLAIHNYHDTFNSLPTAVITDENGRPMRSWRVAVLPFVESNPLYDMYDQNVPWDDPNNQVVMNTPFAAYGCPSDPPASPCDTNYLMVVGKGTIGGEPNEAVRIRDVTDGMSNTIMVIDVGGSGILWAEPRDITVEEAITYITNPSASPFKPVHPGGVNVLMTDGSVRFVSETIDPGTLRALLTSNGGEPLDNF